MPPLVQPSPIIRYQFFDANGDPLAFGKIYTYAAGTNTPAATYTDHTANTQNSNPIILDAGGYADIWLTASSYKISVHNAADVPLYTIDGLPGLGSIISAGSLHPLFTTSLSGGAINFAFDSVNAYQLFGRFAGTSGDPSYGAVGSDKQITHNESGQMRGSQDLLWDDALKIFTVGTSGSPVVRLLSDSGAGKIIFGTGVAPFIEDHSGSGFFITGENGQDIVFGTRTTGPADYVMAASGGNIGSPRGTFAMGSGSAPGDLFLNDGNQTAGVRAGPHVIGGSLATPETFIAAPTGSLYLTTAGGAMTTLWVKESSPTASTGWVAK
jgi:hypothetical protein